MPSVANVTWNVFYNRKISNMEIFYSKGLNVVGFRTWKVEILYIFRPDQEQLKKKLQCPVVKLWPHVHAVTHAVIITLYIITYRVDVRGYKYVSGLTQTYFSSSVARYNFKGDSNFKG